MAILDVTVAGVIDSYAALLSAITEETDGRANEAALDRFVKQAEGEIQVFLAQNPVRPMRARASLAIDSEYVLTPVDMVKPIALEVTYSGTVYRVPYADNIDMSRLQTDATADNRPTYFTREADEFRIYPAPEATYTATLFYYQKLAGISAANATNWLLTEFPHIYLAGALYYAYRDMPDIEKAGLLKQIFDEGLERLAGAYPRHPNEAVIKVEPAALIPRWGHLL